MHDSTFAALIYALPVSLLAVVSQFESSSPTISSSFQT